MKACVLGVAVLFAGVAVADEIDEPISGEAIVELVPGTDIAAFNAQYGTTTIDSIPGRPIYLLQLPTTMTDDQFELLVAGDPAVVEEEINFSGSDPGGDTRSFYGSTTSAAYQAQTQGSSLRLNEAQQLSMGSGIVVAILDTGVDSTHPVLASSMLPGWNFVTNSTDTSDVARGTDSNANGLPDELVGHGTFIAGIVHLVAPNSQILPVTVLDSDGRATSFRVAKGIYYAIDHQADVINLSMGSSASTMVMSDAIEEARQHWITVVAAGGNYGNSAPVPEQFPAAMESNRTIAVAATDWTGVRAPFSSYGDYMTISAPGVDVIGTFPGGTFEIAEGTSFSTAWTTGAVALLKTIGWDTSPSKIAENIENSAINIDPLNPGFNGLIGSGELDIRAAMDLRVLNPGCAADLNDDDLLDAADFTAWLAAYNAGDFAADQNKDKQLTPADFTAWLANFGAGCP